MASSTFVYVTYIRSTPERVWSALTDPEFIKQYWFGMHCESTFTAGSPWKLVGENGEIWDSGEIVQADPPRRLSIRWQHQMRPELAQEGDSLCEMLIEANGQAVKLTITHSIDGEKSKLIEAVSDGWPKILSNLKSLLETGAVALAEAVDQKRN
jgi:uncharacterized protein YndB with AHSA1/START domain